MTDVSNAKAVMLRRFGGPDVLEDGRITCPVPSEGEVLVRIEASPVNPADLLHRSGRVPKPLPLVLGRDFAGTVSAVGPGVSGFRVGDAVYGYHGNRASNGTNAEAVCLPAALCARRPSTLDAPQCAALVVPGLTAMRLVDRARAAAGHSVLVTGAAGAVGHALIQILRSRGVDNIVCTTSTTLGAARLGEELSIPAAAIVPGIERRELVGRGLAANGNRSFDLAFDLKGGEHKRASFDLVAVGGTVASIVEESADFPIAMWDDATSPLIRKSMTLIFEQLGAVASSADASSLSDYNSMLQAMTKLVEAGRLRPPPIDVRHPFCADTVRRAHELLEEGKATSKLVIRIV